MNLLYNSIRKTFLPFAFLLILSSNAYSQTGKLSGNVTDEQSGEALLGTNIIIEGTNLGAAADAEGYYAIINIRAGVYNVKVRFIGYQTKTIEKVIISSDQTTTLNVTLSEEVIVGEEVVVVAERNIVEFNQTSSVSTINEEDIKNLPVQSLNEIVNLQAGVVDGHFRGGRIGEVQYQVDGVTVNNPYNNSSTLELDRSILEEVQVISGTFDAKYGQAMSGVVNAVLKTGSDKFEFSGEAYGGDYFTTDTERYPYNEDYKPWSIQNYQLTVSGPTGLPQTTFFISGRYFINDGYLFGIRKYMPTDKNDFENKAFHPSGDGKVVPMSTTSDYSGQFKITNQTLSSFQINYQATLGYIKRTYYNHAFRLNPDGIKPNNTISATHGLGLTHTLSNDMFYKLNVRQNYFEYYDYKYEDLLDPRYLQAGSPKGDANEELGAILQGVDLGRFTQRTNTIIVKGDLTWQAAKEHYLEAGGEFQHSLVLFGSPGFFVSATENGQEVLLPKFEFPRTPGIQKYNPTQIAAYAQDRVELGDLVVRAGVRFEYFDAAAQIPGDLQNPANSITGAPPSVLRNTKKKIAVAPRLGFSFPLTASSSVYFSYGHFYQLPGLGLLYSNADYSLLDELQAGGITYGVMGNPDLDPEVTIQYEFGFKQAISNFFGTEISFFYKDIRDLLGVEFIGTYAAAEYPRFTNVDFGGVYGFTISLNERNLGNITTTLDYTLQFAQGNSSDPRETANRAAAQMDPRPRDVPFNWDQRHTLNATAVYFIPDDYSLSLIARFGSGQPYTPEIGSGFNALQETNSGKKNSFFLLDLRAEKYFKFGFLDISVFARVFNLLNTHFVNGFVFNNTGSPDYAINPALAGSQLFDPSRFYEPRRIEFGISFRSL